MPVYTDALIAEINQVVAESPKEKRKRKAAKKYGGKIETKYNIFLSHALQYYISTGRRDKAKTSLQRELDRFRSGETVQTGIDNLNAYIYALEKMTQERWRPNLDTSRDTEIDARILSYKWSSVTWEEMFNKLDTKEKYLPIELEHLSYEQENKEAIFTIFKNVLTACGGKNKEETTKLLKTMETYTEEFIRNKYK